MSEKSSSDWTENIQQYQQAYVDAWQAFLTKSNQAGSTGQTKTQAGNGGSENPWLDAMNNWWQAASDDSSQPAHDFYEKVVEQGNAFLQVAESFSSAFQNAQAGSHGAANQWQEFIEQATGNFQQVFSNSAWQMPLSNWQHVMSSASFLPGDAFQGVKIDGADFVKDNLRANVDNILSTPGVGQAREKQEEQQKLIKLLLEYQTALQEYSEAQAEIALLSVRKFQERLTDIASSEEAEPLSSFKQVYDCWVDCCEEVYADYVITDKYVAIHGRVVNALIAVKQQGRIMVDEILGTLNMPTRREIDTLHYRLHQIRRNEKTQTKRIDEWKTELVTLINDQADQIQALQKQIKAPEPNKAPRRATAKSTTRKTTAPKGRSAAKRTTRKSTSAKTTVKTREAK